MAKHAFCILAVTLSATVAAQSVITTAVGSDWIFPASATPLTAPLGEIMGVAVDSAGNVYGADCGNNFIFKIDTSGAFSVVVGNGAKGTSPDGPALGLRLTCPKNPVFHANGDLYFVENAAQNRIRRLTRDGRVVTVAGGGQNFDEGAPALQAKMFPAGLAFDRQGNLYYSESTLAQRVRRIGPDGTIRTIAGAIESGFAGDGGSAINARFAGIRTIDIAQDGSIFIADSANLRIRVITPDGIIRTYAGNGSGPPAGDGGPALAAGMSVPVAVSIEPSGSLLVTEVNGGVRRISADGIIRRVAGPPGGWGFAGDGGPATSALFIRPSAAVTDSLGNVYIADTGNSRIRKVDPAGRISTFAGNDRWRRGPEEINPQLAGLLAPYAVAVSPSGLVTLTDEFDGGTIRQISAAGRLIRLAGSRPLGGDQSIALNRETRLPRQVAFDAAGNTYSALAGENRVVRVGLDGKIAVIAGTGPTGFSGDGDAATRAILSGPRGVAVSAAGEIYIADSMNHRIRKISRDGIIQTIAGSDVAGFGGDGGPASAALLTQPEYLIFDSAGNLLFSDVINHRIRRIAAGTGIITTIAGSGFAGFTGDNGPATAARLNSPRGLALDASGNLYICDVGNHRVRVVRPDGTIRTLAGKGTAGFSGDGGAPLAAELSSPIGVAVDNSGRIYIADSGNDRIRVILPTLPVVTTSPSSLTITPSSPPAEIRLSATISDLAYSTSTSARWLSVSPSTGTMPASLLVRADPAGLAPGTYTGTVNIDVPLGTPPTRQVAVTFTVEAANPPKLSVGSQTLSFNFQRGAAPSSIGLGLANQGGGTLPFTASVRSVSGGDWLSASPASGQLAAGANATLNLTATPGTLAEGTYSATLSITGAGTTLTIPVTMAISRPGGKILLSQTGLTFTAVEGGGLPSSQTFGVLNEGAGELPFEAKATTLSGGEWLKLDKASGNVLRPLQDVSFIEVIPDTRALTQGDYYAEVRVTSPGLTPQLVTVVVKVLPPGSNPGPEIRPTGLVFVGAPGETPPSADVRVSNLVSRATTYTSSSLTLDGGKWLSHLPVSAIINPDEPRRVVVQPDFQNVGPGIRRAAIFLLFDDGSSRSVSVLSIVPDAASKPASKSGERQAANCAQQRLLAEFQSIPDGASYAIGQPVPIEVKVADECGNLLLGTEKNANSAVYARFSNSDPDVRLVPVGNGVWSGTWRPVNPSQNVIVSAVSVFVQGLLLQAGRTDKPVRLTANPNAPIVRQGALVQSASQRGDSPVAPGTLVSIYGANLASDSEPTEVLLGGEKLPLLFTSAGQINAQVPFNLPANTAHQIVVRRGATLSVPESFTVGAAQPGIFTVNQQGSGQGVVVGPDQITVAGPEKPAQRGQVVIIYCTGLGAVTPPVTAGQPAPAAPLSTSVNPVQVTVGDKPAQVFFAGLSPGFFGLYQVNAILATDTPIGDRVPLTILSGGQLSNSVTIAVR